MTETYNKRTGVIGYPDGSGGLDVSHQRNVTILVSQMVPIVSIPDRKNLSFVIGEKENTTPSVDSLIAVLTTSVPTDNRYVFIGEAESHFTGNYVDFYYDTIFKDILIVPKFESFGGQDEAELLSHQHIEIRALKIGWIRTGNNPSQSLVLPYKKEFDFKLETCNVLSSTSTQLLSLTGLPKMRFLNNVRLDVNATNTVDTNGLHLQQFIKIGTTSDLTSDTKVPMQSYLPMSISIGYLKDVGKQISQNIYIPLNF